MLPLQWAQLTKTVHTAQLGVKTEYYQNCFIFSTCYLFHGHS